MVVLIFSFIFEAFMWIFYSILLNMLTFKRYHNSDIANIKMAKYCSFYSAFYNVCSTNSFIHFYP